MRCRTSLTVLLLVIAISTPARGDLFQASDVMSVFFDLETLENSVLTTEPAEMVEAYLILAGPSATDGVRGWDLRVATHGRHFSSTWTLAAGTDDDPSEEEFHVVLPPEAACLPISETILLATWRAYILETSDVVHFTLPPLLVPGYAGARPSYLGCDGTVYPAHRDLLQPGYVVAAVNADIVYLTDTGAPATTPRPISLRAYPNPFNPSVEFAIEPVVSGDARIVIHDGRGRHVRTLEPSEAGRAMWHGRDASGHPSPSGSYFATLRVQGRTTGPAQRLSLVR